jgi:hypothetical protein
MATASSGSKARRPGNASSAKGNGHTRASTRERTAVSSEQDESGGARKAATLPLVAGGAAAAGLAAGSVLGAKLRRRKRPRVLGIPMPRGSELKAGAECVANAQRDLSLGRAQADESQRLSPIEVVLAGLTSRRVPARKN